MRKPRYVREHKSVAAKRDGNRERKLRGGWERKKRANERASDREREIEATTRRQRETESSGGKGGRAGDRGSRCVPTAIRSFTAATTADVFVIPNTVGGYPTVDINMRRQLSNTSTKHSGDQTETHPRPSACHPLTPPKSAL